MKQFIWCNSITDKSGQPKQLYSIFVKGKDLDDTEVKSFLQVGFYGCEPIKTSGLLKIEDAFFVPVSYIEKETNVPVSTVKLIIKNYTQI